MKRETKHLQENNCNILDSIPEKKFDLPSTRSEKPKNTVFCIFHTKLVDFFQHL